MADKFGLIGTDPNAPAGSVFSTKRKKPKWELEMEEADKMLTRLGLSPEEKEGAKLDLFAPDVSKQRRAKLEEEKRKSEEAEKFKQAQDEWNRRQAEERKFQELDQERRIAAEATEATFRRKQQRDLFEMNRAEEERQKQELIRGLASQITPPQTRPVFDSTTKETRTEVIAPAMANRETLDRLASLGVDMSKANIVVREEWLEQQKNLREKKEEEERNLREVKEAAAKIKQAAEEKAKLDKKTERAKAYEEWIAADKAKEQTFEGTSAEKAEKKSKIEVAAEVAKDKYRSVTGEKSVWDEFDAEKLDNSDPLRAALNKGEGSQYAKEQKAKAIKEALRARGVTVVSKYVKNYLDYLYGE